LTVPGWYKVSLLVYFSPFKTHFFPPAHRRSTVLGTTHFSSATSLSFLSYSQSEPSRIKLRGPAPLPSSAKPFVNYTKNSLTLGRCFEHSMTSPTTFSAPNPLRSTSHVFADDFTSPSLNLKTILSPPNNINPRPSGEFTADAWLVPLIRIMCERCSSRVAEQGLL